MSQKHADYIACNWNVQGSKRVRQDAAADAKAAKVPKKGRGQSAAAAEEGGGGSDADEVDMTDI